MYLITNVDRVNISTAASEMQKELHLSNTELGWRLGLAILSVVSGHRRLGRRPLRARKTLFWCGLIWRGDHHDGLFTSLLTLFIAASRSASRGANFPTATRALQYWTPADKRGFAQG